MCANCEAFGEEVEGARSAQDLYDVVQGFMARGGNLPPETVRLIARMATFEAKVNAAPDLTPEERAKMLMDLTIDMEGPRLDQEFAKFRDGAYELIDIAGIIAVVEEDTLQCWMQVTMAVAKKANPVVAIGMLCALLVELGRQPELVADIRRANARFLDD